MVPTTPDHPLKASQRQNRTGRPRLFPHIRAQIEASIEQGAFPPGTALASEHRLCEQFGVSRSLIRKVLGELTARKRIISVPGKGYFVSDPRQRVEAGAIVCLFGTPKTSRIWLDTHVAGIAEGLQEVIGQSPHRLLFEVMYPAPTSPALPVKPVLNDQRGAILVPLSNQAIAPVLTSLPGHLPKVIAGRPAGNTGLSCVYVDHRQAMAQTCRHLLELGHRRIGFIRKQAPSWAQDERLVAYQQTLTEADIHPEPHSILRATSDSIEDIRALLERKPGISALVVATGELLPETLGAIEQAGRRLGHDLALMAWDDTPLAREHAIPITVIRQPTRQLGEIAAQLLLEHLSNPTAVTRECVLTCELILRPSVCSV